MSHFDDKIENEYEKQMIQNERVYLRSSLKSIQYEASEFIQINIDSLLNEEN